MSLESSRTLQLTPRVELISRKAARGEQETLAIRLVDNTMVTNMQDVAENAARGQGDLILKPYEEIAQ